MRVCRIGISRILRLLDEGTSSTYLPSIISPESRLTSHRQSSIYRLLHALQRPIITMATPIDVEPFPELTPTPSIAIRTAEGHLHRRRKSSNLRGDPRGDTTAPALATLYDQSPSNTAVNSPVRTIYPITSCASV
jgi:hypothetical protein